MGRIAIETVPRQCRAGSGSSSRENPAADRKLIVAIATLLAWGTDVGSTNDHCTRGLDCRHRILIFSAPVGSHWDYQNVIERDTAQVLVLASRRTVETTTD
jgi:hypothetical protein